ncbi:uncharacterized protein SOCE26_048790 [Sorangium cellulosum]|uniref:VWFA domain-containing protein n=2 Tax=Sorangium cellulosum TaxID=56 RepID=A0A2L0EVU7_SORCE|nr:uncharacterized protein SOCE26_048790 [Sorangium cellulosum]
MHTFRVLNSDGSVFGEGSFTFEGTSTGGEIAHASGAAAGSGSRLTAFSYRDPVVGTMGLRNVLTFNFVDGDEATSRFLFDLGDPPENVRGLVAGTASPGRHGHVSTHRGPGGALNCQGKRLEFPERGGATPARKGDETQSKPAVDLVVVIDTSSSMADEADLLSKAISAAITATQSTSPSDLRVTYLGIEGTFKKTRFETTVRNYLTQTAKVDASLLRGRTHENLTEAQKKAFDPKEDGARAIEDVATHFDWRPGAVRSVFFLSDEPLEGGLSATGQDQEDIEAASRAIEVARRTGTRVHMYMGTGKFSSDARKHERILKEIEAEYARVARETGGQFFPARAGLSEFQAMLEKVLRSSNARADAFEGAVAPKLYDVGAGRGKVEWDGKKLTLTASGTSFKDVIVDGFSYLAVPLDDDGAITVRVSSLDRKDPDVTVGVQVRETLDNDSRYVMVHWGGDGYAHCSWRDEVRGVSKRHAPRSNVGLPLWLRIERKGDEFICSVSRDENGEKLEEIARLTMVMTRHVQLGVALSSSSKEAATAVLDRCSVARPEAPRELSPLAEWFGPAGAPQLHDIGHGIGKWEWDGHTIRFRAVGTERYNFTVDDCSFLAVPFSGDGQLTVRVLRLDSTHVFTKVGVQIRETLEKGSRLAMIGWEPQHIACHYRWEQEEYTHIPYIDSPRLPAWIRVVRKGNELTCWYSTDGERFTQLDSARTILMTRQVYAGIILSSLAPRTTTAVLDRYSLESL